MRLPKMFHKLGASLLLIALSVTTFAQSSGFDVSRMDKSAAACDDFYQFVNGTWEKNTEIPAKYPYWGSFVILADRNQKILYELLEAASQNTTAKPGSETQLIGDYYASCMDEAAVEKAGVAPLEPLLKQIAALKNTREIAALIGQMHRTQTDVLFDFDVEPDFKNSGINIVNAWQGGLSLPNRDYYTKDDEESKQIRAKFLQYAVGSLSLLDSSSSSAPRAKSDSEAIMRLQTRLAGASKPPVELRDPEKSYHKMSFADLQKLTPNFDWNAYLTALGAPRMTQINMAHPDFFREINQMLADVSLADWKSYLRWMAVSETSTLALPKKFDDQLLDFRKTLTGVREQRPRRERCVTATDAALGEAVGQEYVKRRFTPEAKKRVDEMITNLFTAHRERLQNLDWMTPETKKQAIAKLDTYQRKIGFPDKLRGFVGLKIDRQSYFDNRARALQFEAARNLQDIEKPVDRTRWDTSASDVEASYNPLANEIVFAAGILQPPFFNPAADDAINYGAIGAVIGHEITHGFDDQGSQFDHAGNLKNWWTADDRQRFEEKASCVSKQFGGYEVQKDLFINGDLTLGENIADLGGVTIAYAAYQKSLAGKPRPKDIDGFTPEQRFFLSWAQIWAEKSTPELVRLQVQNDPHAISRFRANGPLANLPVFAEAFGCKVGDKMVRETRCQVW